MKIHSVTAFAAAAAIAVASVAATAPAQAARDGQYGRHDAGGFRNVLPPGSKGVDNQQEFLDFIGSGVLPRHWADQQPLYENLLYAAPTLKNRQIGDYFKDATFGVAQDDRGSTERPRKGVKIIRDASWGVPHIYGKTRRDTMFGAGYAGAADRLFLMDVMRHTGRADLTSFLGGGNLSSDESQWRFAPYTNRDLRKQVRLLKEGYGKLGRRAVSEVRAYVGGINAYITKARSDARLMPAEYSLIGKKLRRWKMRDVIATASLIGGIFGRGGGSEVTSSEILRALEKRFGVAEGRRVWYGFRSKEDPEAPTTISARFPFQNGDAFSPRGLAIPRAGSVREAPVVTSSTMGATAARSDSGTVESFGDALEQERNRAHMSNWELVAARNSANGRAIAVMGPQVGYYLPQILVESDLHGPGIDARGVAFAGLNMFVQMGHGRDYAWSATSAGSDNVDTFAEVRCGGDKHHYLYKGRCLAMEKLTRVNTWEPNVIDPTPAGSATLTSWRTKHGIVTSYGTVKGKKVAFVIARSTYFHEADSIIGFSRFNNPKFVHSPQSFQRAAQGINFTFNWAYTDGRSNAYFLSGAYPLRAPGTSPDFPVLGTGAYDWQGFNPRTYTFDQLPAARHAQTLDPDVMVSWNNKQAPGWAAADDQWGYGPLYRSQMIDEQIQSRLTKGKVTLAQLVKSMELPATQDIRGLYLMPLLHQAVGNPGNRRLAKALKDLDQWTASGAHRRDLDKNGRYEHNRAIRIMDAWWPLLVQAEFEPTLGRKAFQAIQTMIPIGAVPGDSPRAPSFSDGWYGYVSKDLRMMYDPASVQGRYPHIYCGDGNKADCRELLRTALRAALTVTPQELYGRGSCTDDPQASCWDKNRPRVTSAISKPGAFPFQNRPTFQQVVSVKQQLG
ncbi:MAG: penicillin acylase family protein [Candidatus Nanopelagicales bacterium]